MYGPALDALPLGMDTTFSLQRGATETRAPCLCHQCKLHIDFADISRHALTNHGDEEPRVVARGHSEWIDGSPERSTLIGRIRARLSGSDIL